MEDKDTKMNSMEAPPYTLFSSPKPGKSRKWWIVGGSIMVVLVIFIAAATLIGVYMTQKHTEQMVTMALNSGDGQVIQQTIIVNDREDVAVFFVITETYSATTLYDYKQKIIGIRISNISICYLLHMDEARTPSIAEILKTIAYYQSQDTLANDSSDDPSDEDITYVVRPVAEANPREVGINVNILCSDIAIYWSRLVRPQKRKSATEEIKVEIKAEGSTQVTVKIQK